MSPKADDGEDGGKVQVYHLLTQEFGDASSGDDNGGRDGGDQSDDGGVVGSHHW